jgi:hypothetical protein
LQEIEPMAEWEYRKISLSDVPRRGDDIDLLNDAGKEGWELVGISNNDVAYMKRQHGEPAPTPPARRRTTAARTQDA